MPLVLAIIELQHQLPTDGVCGDMTEKYGGNGKDRRSVFAGQRSVIRGRVAHGKYVPHYRGAVTPGTWEERLSDVSHTRNLTILVGHICRVWQTK